LRGRLEKLYDRHQRQLLACALSVTRCRDLAEDAVHEAFCRVLRQDDPPRDLRAYVFRSVRNAAVDLVRRAARTAPLVEDYIVDRSNNQRDAAERKQFQRFVAEAMAALPQDERETIVQHLYADLTFREIAAVRDRPLGTIVTWYRRGLARLRDRLEEVS
jgi:RNA polymerase sigma-70 factor (ECF subfamily)